MPPRFALRITVLERRAPAFGSLLAGLRLLQGLLAGARACGSPGPSESQPASAARRALAAALQVSQVTLAGPVVGAAPALALSPLRVVSVWEEPAPVMPKVGPFCILECFSSLRHQDMPVEVGLAFSQ